MTVSSEMSVAVNDLVEAETSDDGSDKPIDLFSEDIVYQTEP